MCQRRDECRHAVDGRRPEFECLCCPGAVGCWRPRPGRSRSRLLAPTRLEWKLRPMSGPASGLGGSMGKLHESPTLEIRPIGPVAAASDRRFERNFHLGQARPHGDRGSGRTAAQAAAAYAVQADCDGLRRVPFRTRRSPPGRGPADPASPAPVRRASSPSSRIRPASPQSRRWRGRGP